ncbi:MAG: hypothetical protein NVSMB25_18060 [Thermoleophilaceae bacterium]
MKLRLAVAAVLAASGALLLGPGSALAQTSTAGTSISSFNNIPVTGNAANHKQFRGTFTVDRFITRGGSTFASGELKGKVGRRSVDRRNVLIPIAVDRSGVRSAATCPILNLTLGPVDLNLLGLRVQLNQVHLVVTAVQGPGNLLGNLLCSVANLLNQQSLPAGNVAGLLGIVQQLLATPALLGL